MSNFTAFWFLIELCHRAAVNLDLSYSVKEDAAFTNLIVQCFFSITVLVFAFLVGLHARIKFCCILMFMLIR